MSEKLLNSRIVHKHDTEENWLKATNFYPKQGEIIVYDKDATYNYERFKIGDGVTLVSSLPFADDTAKQGVSALSTIVGAVNTRVDNNATAISNLSTLVGDTSVAEQINAANMIYIGPNEPTDANIKVWINTAEEGTGVVPVLPRMATITLAANKWVGSATPYSQTVNVPTVTSASKVDLQPTAAQIVSLQNDDIALMAENVNGTVTFYSFGGKPSTNMTMHVLLTEVAFV